MKRCSKFLMPMLEFKSNYVMGFSRWRLKLESIGIVVRRLWLCATMGLLSNLYLRFVHYTCLISQHAWVPTFELIFQLLSNICGIWIIVSFLFQELRHTPDEVIGDLQWNRTRENMENYLRGFRDYETSNWFWFDHLVFPQLLPLYQKSNFHISWMRSNSKPLNV